MSRKKPSLFLVILRLIPTLLITTVFILAFLVRRCFIRSPDKEQLVASHWMHRWGKITARLFGYQIHQHDVDLPKGSLILPNHVGYGDIIILLAICPCLFVSKADIEKWPLFGIGARLGGIIWINRKRDRGLQRTNEQIKHLIQAGHRVVVFLEAKTTNGQSVERFHSNFLQPAIDVNAPIVPLALKWSTRNPHLEVEEDIAFWRADHALHQHIYRHLGMNSKIVDIRCGEVLDPSDCRKSLAESARQQIINMLASTS